MTYDKGLDPEVEKTLRDLCNTPATIWMVIYHPDNGEVYDKQALLTTEDMSKTLDDFANEYAARADVECDEDTSNINTLGDFRVCFCYDPERYFASCMQAKSYNFKEE